MSINQRMNRIDKLVRDLDALRCPRCKGVDGESPCARIFVREGDKLKPLEDGWPGLFNSTGHCPECGARAMDIILCYPGARL